MTKLEKKGLMLVALSLLILLVNLLPETAYILKFISVADFLVGGYLFIYGGKDYDKS